MTNFTTSLLPQMAEIWQETLNWQPNAQQQAQFQNLYELIFEGNSQLNLTRITDPEEFWEKHLWDSLRGIIPLLSSEKAWSGSEPAFIDIGTGAGFPGIPVASVVTNCRITLLDSTRKKITFIEKILTELALNNAKTLIGRAEEIGQQPEHREGAERAVTDVVVIVRKAPTAEIAERRRRRINEGLEARPMPADQAPDQAESQQREHRVAKPGVPDHRIAAGPGRGDRAEHAAREGPMENPRGQVPDPHRRVLLVHRVAARPAEFNTGCRR